MEAIFLEIGHFRAISGFSKHENHPKFARNSILSDAAPNEYDRMDRSEKSGEKETSKEKILPGLF
jgi:hypothetical protein